MEKAHWVVIGVDYAKWTVRGWKLAARKSPEHFEELPADPATNTNLEQVPALRVHEVHVDCHGCGKTQVIVVVVID